MSLPAYATPGQRLWRLGFRLFCALVFIFLVAPIVTIMPISLSAGSLLNYPLPGLSWQQLPLVSSRPEQHAQILFLASLLRVLESRGAVQC